MSAHNLLKTARKPVALAVLGLLVVQTAIAQNAAETTTPAASADSKLESVVVSGSRIKRDVFSSPAPITVIRSEDAALSGLGSTAEILLSTGITGGQGQINNAFGGYVTDGGPGANTVGLRGFSPTRTLILLNGRRMTPSGTRGSVGAADLNTLPSSIVDRVEVLKDGASSIYGSDAVAGVINIITKKDLNSVRLDASTSISEHGGGNKTSFSVAGGQVNDHSRFLVSYNFRDEQALTLGQRDWTRCNTTYQRATNSDGTMGDWGSLDYVDPTTGKPKCYPTGLTGENGVTINTIGTSSATGVAAPGAKGTNFNRWRPNSSVTTGVSGYEGVGGGAAGANSLYIRDTFDKRMLNNSLLSPVRNHNLFAQGGFDIAALGDAEAYWELLYNRRESSQVGFRQLSLDYAKGSPLIPANLAFSTVQSAPTVITNGKALGVRAFVGAGNSYSSQDVDFVRAVGGLRGSIGNTGWDYDVSLQHAESRGEYTFDGFSASRLNQSLNVVASGTGFNCVDTSNGCVAGPALTTAVVGGQLPQAWLNYVYGNYTGVTKYKEDIVSASATGKLFKLPYGDVKAAVGAEFRQNKIDDTPSIEQQTGDIYNFTSSSPTRGKDQATDFFGEVEAPLLKRLPLVHELTVNASARVSDYKSYGTGTTHKYGINYAPTQWLALRGTNGTSYRAPALFEQFVGATTGFLSASGDPCNDNASKSATRQANCAADGLAGDFSQKSSITSITQGGRESGLKAETSKNASWGFVLQPTLPAGMGDFSFAMDRFDIKVDNGVSQVGTANILARCYDSMGKSSQFCRLVTRDPGNSALSVNNSYVNVATDIVRGYDFNLRYENNVGVGKLSLQLEATHYNTQSNKLFADSPVDDVNGNVGSPKWAGDLDVNYKVQGWNFHYGMEFVGKTSSYAYPDIDEDPATSQYKFSTPNYFLHSVSVTYNDTVSKWKVTAGVRNLADKAPPQISAGYYNRVGNAPLYSGYDYNGRRFFLNVSKTF